MVNHHYNNNTCQMVCRVYRVLLTYQGYSLYKINVSSISHISCMHLLSYTLDTTSMSKMCRMFSSVSIATECMCGTSPGMKVMLYICPPVDTLIIPGEILHILLQSQVY